MLRRSFITGIISALAAPAIVRAELIMPVRKFVTAEELWAEEEMSALIYNTQPLDTPLFSILSAQRQWTEMMRKRLDYVAKCVEE